MGLQMMLQPAHQSKPSVMLLHPGHEGIIVASRNALLLYEPWIHNRTQKVKLQAHSGMARSDSFQISTLASSGVVDPKTNDVYFLDMNGATLLRWDTRPESMNAVTKVASWAVH